MKIFRGKFSCKNHLPYKLKQYQNSLGNRHWLVAKINFQFDVSFRENDMH